jgi:hypothetical protein
MTSEGVRGSGQVRCRAIHAVASTSLMCSSTTSSPARIRGRAMPWPRKKGSDNSGMVALSGPRVARCHAEKRGAWFRVWPLPEPVSNMVRTASGFRADRSTPAITMPKVGYDAPDASSTRSSAGAGNVA